MTDQNIPFPSRVASKRKPKQRVTFFGVVGELLITAAIVLLLYVVWQLWWTTMMVTPNLNNQISVFQMQYPAGAEPEPEHHTDAPPSVGDVPYGEIYGVLHVPKWDWMQIPIGQGTGSDVLDMGYAGHYVNTQQAGEVGNFALAGHRRTYGNNFRRVDILMPKDPLVVETDKAYIVYEMDSAEIVNPDQNSVLLPVPNQPDATPTERLMTLTTCHPEYGNSERFIVYNKFAYWVDKAEGKPGILKDEPAR